MVPGIWQALDQCFLLSPCNNHLPEDQQDDKDAVSLYELLENEVQPLYYDYAHHWLNIIRNGMTDVIRCLKVTGYTSLIEKASLKKMN
jgi:hypothetical protein